MYKVEIRYTDGTVLNFTSSHRGELNGCFITWEVINKKGELEHITIPSNIIKIVKEI